MSKNDFYDVLIVGGSYSGLSAAMSLGRSMRQVLVIDNGEPCNKQTPYTHNFLTQDGKSPDEIRIKAKRELTLYENLTFANAKAVACKRIPEGFELETSGGITYQGKKLLLASGVKDLLPNISGIAECWGISVLHCPYCHGYEVKNEKTILLANGTAAFEAAKVISHWTKDLIVLTNGKNKLKPDQLDLLDLQGIPVVETKVKSIVHQRGKVEKIVCVDGATYEATTVYAKSKTEQQTSMARELGCNFNRHGLIKVDIFQKTSESGIYACGDNSSVGRSVAVAVAAGSVAGIFLNKELVDEAFFAA
jgi:thioredoxin reductase